MNIGTRDIVFLLVGLVCVFSSLTGDPPAKFVTSSLKGQKPVYKPIDIPTSLGSLGKSSSPPPSNPGVPV